MNLNLKSEHTDVSDSNMEEFKQLVKGVFDKCSGHDTYGDVTEFYDEDGVVLMTVSPGEANKLIFSFGSNERFEWDEIA